MNEKGGPEFDMSEALTIIDEATRQARDQFILAIDEEAEATQKQLVIALQVEEHEKTQLAHGLWISFHMANAFVEKGNFDEARRAAQDGAEVAFQIRDDQWTEQFAEILASLEQETANQTDAESKDEPIIA